MTDFIHSKEFLEFCHGAFDNIPITVDFLDKDGRMLYINKAFSDFLEIPIEDMVGKIVTDINPTSKFLETLSSKKADIAVRHKFPNGKDAICHRIPIMDDNGELIGGFGMILFDNINEMKQLIDKIEMLDKQLKLYKREFANLYKAKYKLDDILGISQQIKACKNKVQKIAKVNLNVLITGESGVGKELFAHSIHNESDRANFPFVSINCSAIPETLMEAELFGYEDGSFTGARRGGKIGKFEIANGGTIFLDEIGDMPFRMQAKLLRALQDKEIVRIGGNTPIPLDVRVISATNQNLQQMISDGTFREDLYYRLNVLSLLVPPLRERKDDIPILADSFIETFYKETGLFRKLSDDVIDNLKTYDWPGNVRELKNFVEKLCVNSDKVLINVDDFQRFLLENIEDDELSANDDKGLNELISAYEKGIILKMLKECDNNKTMTAKKLKIPRISLYRKLKEYNLE